MIRALGGPSERFRGSVGEQRWRGDDFDAVPLGGVLEVEGAGATDERRSDGSAYDPVHPRACTRRRQGAAGVAGGGGSRQIVEIPSFGTWPTFSAVTVVVVSTLPASYQPTRTNGAASSSPSISSVPSLKSLVAPLTRGFASFIAATLEEVDVRWFGRYRRSEGELRLRPSRIGDDIGGGTSMHRPGITSTLDWVDLGNGCAWWSCPSPSNPPFVLAEKVGPSSV